MRRFSRILRIALAVRAHPVEASAEPAPTTLRVITVITPRPVRATPTPASRSTQHAAQTIRQPHVPIRVAAAVAWPVSSTAPARAATGDGPPGVTDPGTRPDTGTAPSPVGPKSPTPIPPSPTPGCNEPQSPARATQAIEPEMPDDARTQGLTGTTDVRVQLDSAGNVVSATVYRSSGSAELDGAAVRAARASHYAPATEACEAAAGAYIFKAEFGEP